MIKTPHTPSDVARIVKVGHEKFENEAQVSSILGQDGVAIRLASWEPYLTNGDQVRGTVLMLNGFTEFIEKYSEVVQEFRSRNYHVISFDWRGQGLSRRFLEDRQKGYVDSFSKMVADAMEIYDSFVEPLPRPHILFGHSMGGCVGMRVLQKTETTFDSAVLSAPMFGWDYPALVAQFAATCMIFAGRGKDYALGVGPPGPDSEMEETIYDRLTSDYMRIKRICKYYRAEPRFWMGGPTWKWVLEGAKHMRRVMNPRNMDRLKVPTLLVSPLDDKIVEPKYHENASNLSKKITLLKVPGCKHEILMETDPLREIFWSNFDQFVAEEPDAS